MKRVAVIGAGLSGLVVANRLRDIAKVAVFEKSRGTGGRIATRYAGNYEFDHGAQFFTARTPEFRDFLQPLVEQKVIANWTAQFAQVEGNRVTNTRRWDDEAAHYVGVPGMNAIGKYLARDLDVVLKSEIARIERCERGWNLVDTNDSPIGYFDWVVLSAPAPQTAALAVGYSDLVALCNQRPMVGCFALMLGFAEPIDLPWQAALVRDADISWISVNSSKPGRNGLFTLVAHSTNAWADSHMNDDLASVREHMLNEASIVCDTDLRTAEHCDVHRWRYANIGKHSGHAFYSDDENRLAACGDWCRHGRIEAAFTSADQLSAHLIRRL